MFGGCPGKDVQQIVGYKDLVYRDLGRRWRFGIYQEIISSNCSQGNEFVGRESL